MLQKCSVQLFGSAELAIRLVPLLAALLALPVFYWLASRAVSRRAGLIAVAFFALSEWLIYYAAEGKQYSTDVLWSFLVLTVAVTPTRPATFAILAGLGAVAIWFSHSIVFVLAGVGVVLLVEALRHPNTTRIIGTAAVGALWLASFAWNYWAITKHYAGDTYLHTYWLQDFVPLPVSWAGLLWYPQHFADWFRHPCGLGSRTGILAAAVALVGFIVLARKHTRTLTLILLPLVLALAASALHKYPVSERLMLWATPLLLLPVAVALAERWPAGGMPAGAVGAVGAGVLLIYPLYLASKYTLAPPVLYDVKPALRHVKAHGQHGDCIYLHFGANLLVDYYLAHEPEVCPASDLLVIHGVYPDEGAQDSEATYERDVKQLSGRRRVWVLFAMAPVDRPLVEAALNRLGKRIDQAVLPGSTVDLYDLGDQPVQTQTMPRGTPKG